MRTNSARSPKPGWARPTSVGRAVALALLCNAIGWAAVAASQLWQHARADEPRPYRASASIVLLGMAFLSALWSRQTWGATLAGRLGVLRRIEFWGLVLLFLTACFTACLVLGPTPYARYWFRVALAGVSLLVAWPATYPTAATTVVAWLTQRPARRAAFHALLVLNAALISGEVVLRAWSYCADANLADAYYATSLKFAPGAQVQGRSVNQWGYADDDFGDRTTTSMRRVCLLGDEQWLSDEHEPDCLDSLEQLLTNCELCNCALPNAHPRAFRAQLDRDVAAMRPDLVLACISLRDDLTHSPHLSNQYDYRNLRCYQWGFAHGWGQGQTQLLLERPRDYESFVTRCTPSLAACRTPVPPDVERQWTALFTALDRLCDGCQEAGTPLGLVVAPAEYQISPALCQTLCRRLGCSSSDLDLQLPQRRLAQFAAARRIPLLDLTPVLQTSHLPALEPKSGRWSESASRLAAGALAPWLARQCNGMQGGQSAETVALAQPR